MVAYLDSFLDAMGGIPGWFSTDDARMFCVVNDAQLAAGVAGDLLEVGAYLGKSAILLGHLVQPRETLRVIDPWEAEVPTEENTREQGTYYSDVTLAAFKANYLRFHTTLPDIRQGVSTALLPDLASETYRLIHIDGSHDWPVVRQDVAHVLRLLQPGGIAVFDDMFARHTPGVPAAVWPAVVGGDLIPIATTAKLYAMRPPADALDPVRTAIREAPGLTVNYEHTIAATSMLGVEVGHTQVRLPETVRRFVPPALLDTRLVRRLSRFAHERLDQPLRAPGHHDASRQSAARFPSTGTWP